MSMYLEKRNEKGFTLIELLIAIVVVGILTAVAIVGIAGLTNKGAGASCSTTLDAVKAAEAVHYANTQPSTYPADFAAMTGTTPKELELTGGAQQSAATTITGNGWQLDVTTAGTATTPMVIAATTDGTTPLASCK